MWNEKELLDEIDTYFNELTEEAFYQDLKNAGCLEFLEETSPFIHVSYSNVSNNGSIKFLVADTEEKDFAKTAVLFDSRDKKIINRTNYSFNANVDKLSIGA